MPSRLASLALGTGDIDCIYHIALNELQTVLESEDQEASRDLLDTLVDGNRVLDIADLPFDLLA